MSNLLWLRPAIMMFLCTLICSPAYAQDAFGYVKCGSEIPKILSGAKVSNGRAVVTEGRHKDIRLKNLGGTEVSESLFLESWSMCGAEFELLVNLKTRRIRDVLPFPSHSARFPMSIGPCEVGHASKIEDVLAVLDNSQHDDARNKSAAKAMLAVTAAWKIDRGKERFVTVPTEGLRCSIDGIITVDGGP